MANIAIRPRRGREEEDVSHLRRRRLGAVNKKRVHWPGQGVSGENDYMGRKGEKREQEKEEDEGGRFTSKPFGCYNIVTTTAGFFSPLLH